MNKSKFTALLCLIVPEVVSLIMENYKYDEITAVNEFYKSQLYSVLENEKTKLWHFSPIMLYTMFDEEKKTGSFSFPEET